MPARQIDAIQEDILNLWHRIAPTYTPLVEPVFLDAGSPAAVEPFQVDQFRIRTATGGQSQVVREGGGEEK